MSEAAKQFGLLHHLSFQEREQVIGELGVLYADIYDALESTRDNVRDLEEELDVLLYGENRQRPIDEEWRKTRRFQ